MYSFLMIGQSNMAGRGFPHEVEEIKNNRLYVLRNGKWQPMYVPVNCDRPFSGISLAESFADMCSKEYGVDVGLIPCADGGTTLAQWQPGELLFDHAVYQAKLAMRTSKIAGVLWHHGESDCLNPNYMEECLKIFEGLKKELNLYDIPFIVGGLGDFLPKCDLDEKFKNYAFVNKIFEKMEKDYDYIGYAKADGLTSNPDNLHFNAKSLREFGLRYYEKFKSMSDILTSKTKFNANLTEIEKL